MKGRALLLLLLPFLPIAREALSQEKGEPLVLWAACRLGPADLPPLVLPKGQPGLLVGGLFHQDPSREGAAWKTLLPIPGWKVLAFSGRDAQRGGPDLDLLAKTRGLAVLGAGLEGKGGTSLPSFRVVSVRGIPVAFIGVPASPNLEDRARRLAGVLAEAREKARLVVLLAAMPAREAADLLRRLEGVDLCLVQGGPAADPAPLGIGRAWLVRVPMGGEILSRVRILPGKKGIREIESEFLLPQGSPDPALEEARKRLGFPPPAPGGLKRAGGGRPVVPLPSVSNRACRFLVHGTRRISSYGIAAPPGGKEFLLVDLEVENTIPLSEARKEKLPVAYMIPDLSDHLYLVRDGRALARIFPRCASLPGCLPVRPLALERLGSRRRGNLLFLLPAGWKGSLQLRFYDFVHGNASLDLSPGREPGKGKPALPPVRNRFLEMALFEVKGSREYLGRKAPEDMEYLFLDLRGKSLFSFARKASAFDPGAKEGRVVRIGAVADWKDWDRYIQVVADGDRAFPLLDEGELGRKPRFLPDLFTGGRVVFLVPRKRASLALRMDFPNASAPGLKETVHPEGLVIPLAQGKPPARAGKPLAVIADGVFRFSLEGCLLAGSYRGVKPGAGRTFLALDLAVENRGKKGEFFQTDKQVHFVREDGGKVPLDPSSYRGPRRAVRLLWIPPGERRSFRAVFRIPGEEKQLRLAYSGVTLAKILDLPRPAGPVAHGGSSSGKKGERPPGGKKPGPAAQGSPRGNLPDLPVLGRIRGGGFLVEYLGVVKPGKKKPWKWVEPRGPGQEVLGVRVRVTAEKETRLGNLPLEFQLLAGPLFPCPPVFPGRGEAGGLPFWGGSVKLSPGEPRYGTLAFSVPLGAKPLFLSFFPGAGGEEGRAEPGEKIPFLEILPGPAPEKARALSTLPWKGFEVSLLGVEKFEDRNRPGLTLAFSVALRRGTRPAVFRPFEIVLFDQSGSGHSWSYGRGFALPAPGISLFPGGERRFRLSTVMGDAGERLWLLPHRRAAFQAAIPNPWIQEDRRLYSKEGLLPAEKVPRDADGYWVSPFVAPPMFPEPSPAGLKGAGLKGRQVNEAIRKGALFLIGKKEKRGLDPDLNEDALVVLALLHTEEVKNHPDFLGRAVDYLKTRKLQSVYDAALTLMGLAFTDPRGNRERIAEIARALVEAQSAEGGWSYSEDFVKKVKPSPSGTASGPVQVQGSVPIRGWPGLEKIPPILLKRSLPWREGGGDNSCSQYAMLGLQAAWTAGVRCPKETWERALKWFTSGHTRGKGWGYGPRGGSSGSMTTAGLAGLAIAKFHLGRDSKEIETALREGVDWLARNFRVDRNPASESYHLYYVYGLERAGRLLGKNFFGAREWYLEGARWLVDNQAGDGSWLGFHGSKEILDTSFALLFLTKATEELEAKVPEGKGRLTLVSKGLGGVVDFILDASGSMAIPMEEEGGATRLQVARRVVLQVLKGSGRSLTVGLRVYGHRYSALDKRALEDSELLVPFGPADRPELEKALARIRCRGKTPLTYSLKAALEDLGRAPVGKKRVILLTDGLESDRRARPVQAAAGLARAGARLDVVCFALENTALLERMARAGGGACYSAKNGKELLKSVRSALLGVVSFLVRDEKGKVAGRGSSGDSLELPAGPYEVEIALPGGPKKVKVWVRPGRTTTILVRPGK